MDSSERILLVLPDRANQPLARLPASREIALRMVQQTWVGAGEYAFVREVNDPEYGTLDITEIAVSAYPDGQLGITRLTPARAMIATSDDISLYLRAKTGITKELPIQLSVCSYEESPFAWLYLETRSGEYVAEFGLEARNRLHLSDQPESSSRALYTCELPTCRSVFRFVSIACEVFRCDRIRFRSFPLNSTSDDWFF